MILTTAPFSSNSYRFSILIFTNSEWLWKEDMCRSVPGKETNQGGRDSLSREHVTLPQNGLCIEYVSESFEP